MMNDAFNQLKHALMAAERRGVSLETIATEAFLSAQTLHLWLDGKVKSPRLETLNRVAGVLGKRIEMMESGEMKLAEIPRPTARMALWLRQQ